MSNYDPKIIRLELKNKYIKQEENVKYNTLVKSLCKGNTIFIFFRHNSRQISQN